MSVTYDQQSKIGEANKEIARAYVQKVFNEHRLNLIAEFCAPEIKWHGGNLGTVEGLENVAALVRGFIGALPDLKAAEQEVAVMGDIVAIRYIVEGTHRGNLLGFPATGRHVRWNAIDWY